MGFRFFCEFTVTKGRILSSINNSSVDLLAMVLYNRGLEKVGHGG
jgi:hypothetical protein